MSLGQLQRRMKAAITIVIGVLFVACQLASGPAHAIAASKHDSFNIIGAAQHALAHNHNDDHPAEMEGDTTANQHRHSHSDEPGNAPSAHCDAVCHGLLGIARMSTDVRIGVIATLSPHGESGTPMTAFGRIDRPPSRTASN